MAGLRREGTPTFDSPTVQFAPLAEAPGAGAGGGAGSRRLGVGRAGRARTCSHGDAREGRPLSIPRGPPAPALSMPLPGLLEGGY